jgi:hypothetical protein
VPYNVGMSHPEIIIPFALPPAEHAKDLVKLLASECGADGLATLLARNYSLQRHRYDDFSAQLPHEMWLAKNYHHNYLKAQCNKLSLHLSDGYWFVVQPVNLHIASNHLVLTDYRQLALSEKDARDLFEKARTLCQEIGLQLVFGDTVHWFLRADSWSDLITTSPDAACGHNIEIWSPTGKQALAWRKLQNEIQMEWFIHPIQEQRQQRGEKIVNGLWLWSGTLLKQSEHAESNNTIRDYPGVNDIIHTPGSTVLDQLSSAALASDWSTWIQIMIELERDWFKPLCAALKTHQLKQIRLILSNSNTLLDAQIRSNSLRKFWHSTNFNHLVI